MKGAQQTRASCQFWRHSSSTRTFHNAPFLHGWHSSTKPHDITLTGPEDVRLIPRQIILQGRPPAHTTRADAVAKHGALLQSKSVMPSRCYFFHAMAFGG